MRGEGAFMYVYLFVNTLKCIGRFLFCESVCVFIFSFGCRTSLLLELSELWFFSYSFIVQKNTRSVFFALLHLESVIVNIDIITFYILYFHIILSLLKVHYVIKI